MIKCILLAIVALVSLVVSIVACVAPISHTSFVVMIASVFAFGISAMILFDTVT